MNLDEMKQDYDWKHAFHEAVHHEDGPNYYDEDIGPIQHVTEIHYALPGENDGASWLAIGRWDDGKYFVMEAGCDYTGWDCQAGGTIEFYDSLEVARTELTPEQASRLGLPHDAHQGDPMNQYNEPWRLVEYRGESSIVSCRNHFIANVEGYEGLSHEEAQRVIACINACAGIPNEVLEQTIAMNRERQQQQKASPI